MAKKSKYTYYPQATVTDELDGSVYTLGMTVEKMTVEISGTSHPFYTGKEALVDTAGRIDKFKTREAAKQTEKTEKTRKVRKQKISFEELMKQNSPSADEEKAKKVASDKAKKANKVDTEEKHPKPDTTDAPKAGEETVKEEPKA